MLFISCQSFPGQTVWVYVLVNCIKSTWLVKQLIQSLKISDYCDSKLISAILIQQFPRAFVQLAILAEAAKDAMSPDYTPICDSWDKINNSVDSNLQLLKFKLEARAGSKSISHVETPWRATSPSPSCLKLCNSRVIVFTGPPPKMFKYWKHSLAVWLSRPDKSGRAQISGHLGKIARIMPGFLWFCPDFYKN